MRLVIATEMHFIEYRGHIYAETLGDYAFWQRYLHVFSSVCIVARVRPVSSLADSAERADGEGVEFVGLPDYVGPLDALRKLPGLLAKTRVAGQQRAAFLLRLPGAVGTLLFLWLQLRRWPFAARVVGDPYESLSTEALGKSWAHLFRPIITCAFKRQCLTAGCIAYVTKHTLQRRYPTRARFVTSYSDVWLPDDLFSVVLPDAALQDSRMKGWAPAVVRLIFLGSLAQRYKGLHVLLNAMRLCIQRGMQLELNVLGDGEYRVEYEGLAAQLGLRMAVTFHGQVASGTEVFRHLQSSDLFVMPSLTEGLPRAMLEAMACGLPCIGSAVGGIPELLAAEDTFASGDAAALAELIEAVLSDPRRLAAMSRRNRATAWYYRASNMKAKRLEFYEAIRDLTVTRLQSHEVSA